MRFATCNKIFGAGFNFVGRCRGVCFECHFLLDDNEAARKRKCRRHTIWMKLARLFGRHDFHYGQEAVEFVVTV